MKLFDDIVRDDSPARNAERLYPFLNRSSWTVSERARVLCEEWFSRYPKSDRQDLYRRFTSVEDSDHRGAYFELLLHELLVRLGCTVTVHPTISGTTKRPDFLVSLGDSRFYLEAMVTHAKEADFGDSPIWDAVSDLINEMVIPDYFVNVIFSEVPSRMPTKESIYAQIKRLVQLSNLEVTRQQLYKEGHDSLAVGTHRDCRCIRKGESHSSSGRACGCRGSSERH